ncbi:MAG: hypothetical protein JSU86_04450 [Phycisphaerales bacterium]|nr:MAG: hypothetical protein JSU86_04450 [Phycisphaerales bacterium]
MCITPANAPWIAGGYRPRTNGPARPPDRRFKPEPARPRGPRFLRPEPLTHRLWRKLITRFFAPQPIRRFTAWLLTAYPRAYEALRILSGPKVGSIWIFERRVDVCARCDYLIVQLPGKATGHAQRYCGSCKCGQWFLARLWTVTGGAHWLHYSWLPYPKLRLARWQCPLGKFDETARYAWAEKMLEEHRERFPLVMGATEGQANDTG